VRRDARDLAGLVPDYGTRNSAACNGDTSRAPPHLGVGSHRQGETRAPCSGHVGPSAVATEIHRDVGRGEYVLPAQRFSDPPFDRSRRDLLTRASSSQALRQLGVLGVAEASRRSQTGDDRDRTGVCVRSRFRSAPPDTVHRDPRTVSLRRELERGFNRSSASLRRRTRPGRPGDPIAQPSWGSHNPRQTSRFGT
jgi:hypothetical protein